jgi:hypothetical protein
MDLGLGKYRFQVVAAKQAPKIVEYVSRTGVVVLGGSAPVWAHLAGLRCTLNARNDARVFFLDPKQPERLVEIPPAHGGRSDAPRAFPEGTVQRSRREDEGRAVLDLAITTPDKFLPPVAARNLACAPGIPPEPSCDVAIYQGSPTWLCGTYARWQIGGGARRLAYWDANWILSLATTVNGQVRLKLAESQ